jgi:hypothetical protein
MTTITQSQLSILLTVDEARYEFATSALKLIKEWRGETREIRRALTGGCTGGDRTAHDVFLILDHRRVIDAISFSGHGWVMDEEVEGIVSAIGLDDDRRGDLSVLERVLSASLEDW